MILNGLKSRISRHYCIPPALCGGYATLAQRSAVHVTPRAVYVLTACGGWGGSVELPSILAVSPRRGNCPTLDSIQGQQDPQTDCCRRQTVFSRHPILRSYGTVIGSGVQPEPRFCSSKAANRAGVKTAGHQYRGAASRCQQPQR